MGSGNGKDRAEGEGRGRISSGQEKRGFVTLAWIGHNNSIVFTAFAALWQWLDSVGKGGGPRCDFMGHSDLWWPN